jgi:HEAT repeat protein
MAHVFISYCHEDADFAQILGGKLRDAGLAVRMDLNLSAGDNWRAEIDSDLKDAFAAVVVMSPSAKVSPYVNYEWAFALGAGVPVVALLLKLPANGLHPRLSVLQYLDFSNYSSRPWKELLECLRDLAETQGEFTITAPRDAPPVLRAAARSLDSMNSVERRAAIQSLAQMNHPAAVELLADALRHPSEDVRFGAAFILGETHHDARALPVLLEALRCGNEDLKLWMIIRIGEPAVPPLLEALRDKSIPRRGDVFSILGYIGGPMAVRGLIDHLHDPEPEDRRHAAFALALTKDASAWPTVREAVRDPDAGVRGEAAHALGACAGPMAVPDLLELLKDPKSEVRHAAAVSLGELCNVKPVPEAMEPHVPRLIDALIRAMRDEDDQVGKFASMALRNLADPRAVPGLMAALRDHAVYSGSITGPLAALGEAALLELREGLRDSNERVRIAAIGLIANLRQEADALHLAALLEDGSPAVREHAIQALINYPETPGILQAIVERLHDLDVEVRLAAVETLARLGNPAAAPHLIECLDVEELAESAADALERLDTREGRAALRAWKKRRPE